MTPKEKAEELVNYMQSSLYSDGWEDSKQCALISVNEILLLGKKLPLEVLEYYLEVKKEIEKL